MDGLTVDIVTIHDLDETEATAWTYRVSNQMARRGEQDNDTESRRSSTERSRQHLQENVTMSDVTKKRGVSMRDDTTPGFKDGRITPEGRNQKVAEWELPDVTQQTEPATPGTLLSQSGPSSEPAPKDEPQNEEASVVEPPTNEVETIAIPSAADKDENVKSEAKRTKSVKKRRRKGDPPNAISTVSSRAQTDAGLDSRRDGRDIDEGRASEKDQRSGLPSTDFDGSERKKPVHLFRDSHMIPAAFPGARILAFTYPELSAEKAEEYLDKVTQTLLDSLEKQERN